MNIIRALSCLEAKWCDYIKQRGHRVHKSKNHFRVLRSRNANKVRYRWLLLVSEVPKRFLSKTDQVYIRHQLAQAKPRKEATYLVAGFVKEPSRIVVLPADAALKAGHIRSDKGGIAWED
jgi:hypothetical protein